ncbi:MAG: ABC transporter substrate-binding protein [Oscillospiraceae bacterium]|nr:ABC transporter substrate-binding protein [Oscillospiraceae bacterium]MDD4368243.1 ABC transporter substrate-binding protein [Oscillospiraceae bacterium]
MKGSNLKKHLYQGLSLGLAALLLAGCSSGSSSQTEATTKTTTEAATTAGSTTAVDTTTADTAAATTAGTTAAATTAGSSADDSSGPYFPASATAEEVLTKAAGEGKVGNWGLGNEYEVEALLSKYSLPTDYLSQAFDMDGFDDDSILLASAMTYNELGLVKNDYDGGYGYGDTVATIDMNDEGVAMLEDNLFTTKSFAEENPNTVKAFIYASLKGWQDACADPEAAAQIVFEAGSSVSADHQSYMAAEVKKLVETDTQGNAVSDYGKMEESAMQQTLDLAKQYIQLEDAVASETLSSLTLDDIRDTSYWEAANLSADAASIGTPEKTDVSIQLKWLPQAQFMGYYVAQAKGYYDEVGLNVTITPGGGDIGETTAVYNGTVDFGVTWVSNLIAANAGGMNLLEVAQIYQRSGLVLVYKLNQ